MAKKTGKLERKPAPNSVVKFVLPTPTLAGQYPFEDGEHVLFLGEIENMPDHCIVVAKGGSVRWGYHTENFETVPEDEL